MSLTADSRAAAAAGIDWLRAHQTPGGWWHDFPALPSDEYVTAFVAARLARLPQAAQCVAAARSALVARLRLRRALGAPPGWGWALAYPTDSDSTAVAWAECAADLSPAEQSALRRTLAAGRHPDGQAAYADVVSLSRSTGLPPTADFRGWLAASSCVTVTAVALDPTLLPILGAQQQVGGYWAPYYWADPAYVSALAVIALGKSDRERVAAAAEWACGGAANADSAFDLAWRSILLSASLSSLGPRARWTDHRDHLGMSLLTAQRPDGSWAPGAIMGVPSPGVQRPDYSAAWEPDTLGLNRILTDEQAVLTTASAVAALTTIGPLQSVPVSSAIAE